MSQGATQTSNQSSIYFEKQDKRGQLNSAPKFTEFETTGGRLNKTTSFVKSATIRKDAQATSNMRDSVKFESEIPFEVTEDIQLIMESALRVNNPSILVNLTNSTVSTQAKRIVAQENVFANIEPYSYVFVECVKEPSISREFFVTAVSATALDLEDDIGIFTSNQLGPVTITQRVMRSGKTANYLTAQEREEDDSVVGGIAYTTQKDIIVNTMAISIPTSGPIAATIGLVAGGQLKDYTKPSNQVADHSMVAKVALSNLDMKWLEENKRIVDYKFTETNIDISSNSESIQAAGVEGALDNTINTITCSGSLKSITFKDAPRTEKEKQDKAVRFAMAYLFTFESGKKMVISLQRMVYNDGSRQRATDATASFDGTYDAETNTTNGATVQVDFSY